MTIDASGERALPAVGRLLSLPEARALADTYGRELLVDALRAVVAELRIELRSSRAVMLPAADRIVRRAGSRLAASFAAPLGRVVNATGVALHTNLGRAPLAESALLQAIGPCTGYSDLEIERTTGKRGQRGAAVERSLCALVGGEAALFVNNNAAAVLLVLDTFARNRAVVIARSQLVEIGGGFRLPDILERSGCSLREVGCTNRVHLGDYEAAIDPATAMILVVHRSNFALRGFVSEPGVAELAELARARHVPLVYDLGSGLIARRSGPWCADPAELTVSEALAVGCDLVSFSGDKMFGGPQAGIVVGRASRIAAMGANPLYRAVRVGKLTLCVLAATIAAHHRGDRTLPVERVLDASQEDIRARVERVLELLGESVIQALQASAVATEAATGGGAFPDVAIPSFGIAIGAPAGRGAEALAATLRERPTPVIAIIRHDRLLLDLRTVLEDDVPELVRAMQELPDRLAATSLQTAADGRPAP